MRTSTRLAILLLAAIGCAAPTPTEGEGSNANRQLAGRVVSEDELAGVLRSTGFDEATVPRMLCTAKYESSFHEEATNSNTNGTTDYGIFQINTIHLGSTSGCPSTADELMNVTTNTQCAFGVYNLQGMEAWVAYKSHRAECDAYVAPAASGDPTAADPTAPAAPAPAGGSDPDAGAGCADPSDPSCQDPCVANPNDPSCQDPCIANPNDPSCHDPCIANPDDPSCQDPCAFDPGYPGCSAPFFAAPRTHLHRRGAAR